MLYSKRLFGERIMAVIILGTLMIMVGYFLLLYALEIYDILFFDWFLLCHSGFFPHFYPELKGIVGPQQFGYNKRTHIAHFSFTFRSVRQLHGFVQFCKERKTGMIRQKIIPVSQLPIDKEGRLRSPG